MTPFLTESDTIISQPIVTNEEAALAQLQIDVEELANSLAKRQTKLAERQKQQGWEVLKSEFERGIRQLLVLTDSINFLATQLETQMLDFKKVASETNKAYQNIQQSSDLKDMEQLKLREWKTHSLWQVHSSSVPTVLKGKTGFILTMRIVDLFQREREEDISILTKTAQRRREAFECWLAERRCV